MVKCGKKREMLRNFKKTGSVAQHCEQLLQRHCVVTPGSGLSACLSAFTVFYRLCHSRLPGGGRGGGESTVFSTVDDATAAPLNLVTEKGEK